MLSDSWECIVLDCSRGNSMILYFNKAYLEGEKSREANAIVNKVTCVSHIQAMSGHSGIRQC